MVSSCKILHPNKSATGVDDFADITYKWYSAAEATYMVPSAFTPDSDPPQNFTVYSKDDATIYILKLEILNRWGDIIYRDAGFSYWDGTNAPAGVYKYRLVLEFPDSSIEAVKGDVSLLR
jgi:hypothetical protein